MLNLFVFGSVIFFSGFNFMYDVSMWYLKKNGIVVYLDVFLIDIISCLKLMRIDRIVG